jgi:ribosomal protein S18 acetylase RimI-like enzyme
LRPQTEADSEFLLRLYAGTRADLLSALPPELGGQILRQQFQTQLAHYKATFPAARYDLITVAGAAVGRLYVNRSEAELRILDITLLPEHRGQGLGTQILGTLLEEAGTAGLPIRLHVERKNPAVRLYQRLDFLLLADEGIYFLMEHQPPS